MFEINILLIISPHGVMRDPFLWHSSTAFVFPLVTEKQHRRRIEMDSPLKSSPKCHRVREFLPSVKPSYLSLILVLVCGMSLMRNESTNDRLLALEKQMTVLSARKSCDETGSPLNSDDETSDSPIADSVILVRKTAKPLEKKPYFTRGINYS